MKLWYNNFKYKEPTCSKNTIKVFFEVIDEVAGF